MKVTARVGGRGAFGGIDANTQVEGKEVIISSKGNFSVSMEEIGAPGVNGIDVYPGDLSIRIKMEDGWVFAIARNIHEDFLFITRSKGGEAPQREYLAVNGRWFPMSRGYSPHPPGILKIPFMLKEVPA